MLLFIYLLITMKYTSNGIKLKNKIQIMEMKLRITWYEYKKI